TGSGASTLAQATPWSRRGNDTVRIAQMNVSLRPLEDRDLDTIFQQVTDPESVRMAAFTAEDQTDRRAFLNRMSRLRADTSVSHRVIDVDGGIAPAPRLRQERNCVRRRRAAPHRARPCHLGTAVHAGGTGELHVGGPPRCLPRKLTTLAARLGTPAAKAGPHQGRSRRKAPE